MTDVLVRTAKLGRTFGSGDVTVTALADVDIEIRRGEFAVLLGPSGSGKTSLLNLIGALDRPSKGTIDVAGIGLHDLDDEARTDFRRTHVGFVFQFFNLIPTLTALENVQLIADLTSQDGNGEARSALEAVGLGNRLDHFPAALSGGEQQRVAVARAVAKGPSLLLADEPTGSLDLDTGRAVLDLLRRLNRDQDMTVLIVTHNAVIARMADRVLHLHDGRLSRDERNGTPVEASALEW